jgi:hypothetical protein
VTDSIETSEDAVNVTVAMQTDQHLPGSKSVALFLLNTKSGISVELAVEGGGDTIDPRDPAHCAALYVQHNLLQLLPQAALWMMHLAQDTRKQREGRATPAAGVVDGTALAQTRAQQAVLVDSSGIAILPQQLAPVESTPTIDLPTQPEFVSEGGTPD